PLDFALARIDRLIAAGHVLPDEDAELVTPVVPTLWLDFDVFADHVEPELLGQLNVVLQRLIGRRGVQAVWPKALIERANLEIWLSVEEKPCDALVVLRHLDLAHGEVAFDLVVRYQDA